MRNWIKRNSPFISVSIAIHIIVAFLLSYLLEIPSKIPPTPIVGSDKPLKIKSIVRNKVLGEKDGNKNYTFQVKDNQEKNSEKELDLSSLAISPNIENIKPNQQSKNKPAKESSKLDYSARPLSSPERMNQKRFLKKISTERYLDPVLSNSNFALNPEIPQGVSEDELNSADKVFYSFQKRTMEQYLSSFVDQYQNMKRAKPQIKAKLISKQHLLTGRITFDKMGNIVTIKIMKSSQDDDIHMLFEETLKGIGNVPNPPDDIISSDDQFTIYYVLKIN